MIMIVRAKRAWQRFYFSPLERAAFAARDLSHMLIFVII